MRISVIIPTLNEERGIQPLLLSVMAMDEVAEVIVADGGSEDKTRDLARNLGAEVIETPKGRGQQLRSGAERAGGDVLWFLHADTEIRSECGRAICTALSDPSVVGGNFRLLFDGGSEFAEWLTGFYSDMRERGFYYGDSGIFVRRPVYDSIGGIRAIALMEDYDFVCRLEKTGETVNLGKPALITSSRRFQNRRKWRIVLQWIWLHMLYHLHVSPDLLARLYRSQDHSPGEGAIRKKPAK